MVDSGTFTHATSRCDLFSTYKTGDFRVVRMGKLMSSKYEIIVSKLAMGLL